MSLSMKDHALLVKLFYKYGDCLLVSLNKSRSLNGMKKGCGPMSVKGLKKIIKKFEETSSFNYNLSGRGNQFVSSSVTTPLLKWNSSRAQPCNARGIARYLDMPVGTVYNILSNIPHCYIHTKLSMLRLVGSVFSVGLQLSSGLLLTVWESLLLTVDFPVRCTFL